MKSFPILHIGQWSENKLIFISGHDYFIMRLLKLSQNENDGLTMKCDPYLLYVLVLCISYPHVFIINAVINCKCVFKAQQSISITKHDLLWLYVTLNLKIQVVFYQW